MSYQTTIGYPAVCIRHAESPSFDSGDDGDDVEHQVRRWTMESLPLAPSIVESESSTPEPLSAPISPEIETPSPKEEPATPKDASRFTSDTSEHECTIEDALMQKYLLRKKERKQKKPAADRDGHMSYGSLMKITQDRARIMVERSQASSRRAGYLSSYGTAMHA